MLHHSDAIGPPTVLLVEDDLSQAELLMRSLHELPERVRVEHVCDGEAALERLLDRGPEGITPRLPTPSVVLLDLRIPKLSGLEVLTQLRAYRACAPIPVVILSSSDEARDIARAYAAGANSYLVKPLGYAELDHALRQVVAYWIALNRTA